MTEPISAMRSGGCDPNLACCEEPVAGTEVTAQAPRGTEGTAHTPAPAPVVTIPPVYIEGDASQQLVKGYDQKAAAACRPQRISAQVACPGIASAVIDSGPASAFTAGLGCAAMIALYDDCKNVADQQLKFADRCEAMGKVPVLSARPGEVLCMDRP